MVLTIINVARILTTVFLVIAIIYYLRELCNIRKEDTFGDCMCALFMTMAIFFMWVR